MLLAALVMASGCAAGQAATPTTLQAVPDTVELGAFPEPLSESPVELSVLDTTPVMTAETVPPPPDPIEPPLADEVDGNRILLIGDTVMASSAPRHDGEMCDALAAFGWQGEIAAEFGRFVQFGRTVTDDRLSAGADGEPFDVVAVMLGNHFDGDAGSFRAEFDALMIALDGRPTIVYTLVEDDSYQIGLNVYLRALPATYPNVFVVDFAEIIGSEAEILVADTPSGLNEEGLGRLALHTVATLGEPSTTENAGCVDPVFVDDSAIVL